VPTPAAAQTPPSLSPLGRSTGKPIARDAASEAREREQLLDRLRSLRRVLPVLAQEMAAARRQAAHLRLDNRRLTDQVRELRAQLEVRGPRAR
jgi:hypothetical protein